MSCGSIAAIRASRARVSSTGDSFLAAISRPASAMEGNGGTPPFIARLRRDGAPLVVPARPWLSAPALDLARDCGADLLPVRTWRSPWSRPCLGVRGVAFARSEASPWPRSGRGLGPGRDVALAPVRDVALAPVRAWPWRRCEPALGTGARGALAAPAVPACRRFRRDLCGASARPCPRPSVSRRRAPASPPARPPPPPPARRNAGDAGPGRRKAQAPSRRPADGPAEWRRSARPPAATPAPGRPFALD